ncbi:response regulator [Calothrix sp. 336/3]|uniref:response regulator n=1 Tax=Calothrix sp. 336/3 TaxID=1337936 RepID=UPI00069BE76B|nr:response regulator [Calothrix sp. 336/3]
MVKNLKIGTKIGASFACGLTVIATLGILAYRTTNNLVESSRWQSHSYEVLNRLDNLISILKDAEIGQRGYLITAEKPYLEPYTKASEEVEKNLQVLQKLTNDNPNQENRLSDLRPLINRRLSIIQETITALDSQGFEAARKIVLTDRGKVVMDEIRSIITQMQQEERTLLAERSRQTQEATNQAINTIIYGIPIAFLLLTIIGIYLTRNISLPLQEVSEAIGKMANGDFASIAIKSDRQDEIGLLVRTFNQMIDNLRHTTQRNQEQNWLKSNLAKFSQMLQGERDLDTAARMILSEMAPLVNAQQGVFYILDNQEDEAVLKLLAGYAYQQRKNLSNRFHLGEGLVGQCALEKQKILLTNVPHDYIHISSGLGETQPVNIIVLPILFENQVIAVLELASLLQFSPIELDFLEQVSDIIGIVINTIYADKRTQELLSASQSLTEQLQSQQLELQESNQRLGQQAYTLQASEELLRQQQHELQQSNEELQQLNAELEEKAELLVQQNQEVERKNQEVETAKQELEEKAAELTLSSKYKSEFLANMSHELRTPLNSLLILAKLLADNSEGNLSNKQVEYGQTIYSAGRDLLMLINDILDLAKIESGTISIDVERLLFTDLIDHLERSFRQIAVEKGVNFTVNIAPEVPMIMYTDGKRLQQILNNLLANSFKFTHQGEISLRVGVAQQGWNPENNSLKNAEKVISFAVSDTGIGIAPEKQKIIFEAFQQADGTTSRKYGGTGLGLSISREIAHLLGGEIQLRSQLGQGSTFTLYLPYTEKENREDSQINPTVEVFPSPANPVNLSVAIADDRQQIQSRDGLYSTVDERTLLIIEDDINFARILLDMAQQQEFKGIVATNGKDGLALAQQYQPSAIILDIRLPEIDGWTVLERLKQDPKTRHIPVHIITAEDSKQRGLQLGAIAYLQKPVSREAIDNAFTRIKDFVDRKVKNLLVVEDDENQRHSIVELIGNSDVLTTAVSTGSEALLAIRNEQFDCLVLDLGLPDINGFELIELIKQEANAATLPIIIYTARELTRAEEIKLRRMAESIIIKDGRSPILGSSFSLSTRASNPSPERLLDETALFLHRVQANLPTSKRRILEQLHSSDTVFVNKKILIVDDDVRNIFALTSLLERKQMQVFYAENGRDGIEILENHPDMNIILMDVMMPEMDGYETTRTIRGNPLFKSLPIIALTAKAMQGDKEKCITAGASDYITKPVDNEKLLSLLRVWLYT